ncbi:MAG TPA: GspE/PulE family protein [Solirubrobacteraceae bacterium]|jgi:type IV pilus assembly protein PilB|nr:GspE/PulE family protein [Solirubrobacteraceae bacterium]
MSDPAQGSPPDLHAILGLDSSAAGAGAVDVAADRADAVPDAGPAPAPAADVSADRDPHVVVERAGAAEQTAAISPEDPHAGSTTAAARPPGDEHSRWSGITRPSRPDSTPRFLTDVIVELGFASREQVDDAVQTSRGSGGTPERVLVERGLLTHDQLSRALAERYGLDHLDLDAFKVEMAAANLVSSTAAKRYQAVPVAFLDKGTLLVAMADPANVLAVDDLAIITGYEVRVAVAPPEDIAALITRLDRLEDVVAEPDAEPDETDEGRGEVVNLRPSADDAPAIKLVNQIIAQAVDRHASDVHLAADRGELRVRFRVDGVLQDITTVPRRMAPGVVSRVKIMADLDIAERRLPQDGRVGLSVDGKHIDLRVVTLPSVHGESVVVRVLDKSSLVMDLDKLGMPAHNRVRFERAFHESHGAVLVTGPTGSGKSTTLYAALQALNTPEKNIITVEDPVEYEIPGLTQIQVSTKTGLTFAAGLRSMVRADPDVIMVGEIRDHETARIAVESALTGHLVLSTLHTNDAPSAVTRLIEMGIEPFLVASAVDCVVAQRLVRVLCRDCKRRAIIPASALRDSGFKAVVEMEAYEPVGCGRCRGSGYRGRMGIYEVMDVSPEIQTMALERRPAEAIRDVAVSQGMTRLSDDGIEKVKQGLTSMAEIARVIGNG